MTKKANWSALWFILPITSFIFFGSVLWTKVNTPVSVIEMSQQEKNLINRIQLLEAKTQKVLVRTQKILGSKSPTVSPTISTTQVDTTTKASG